VRSTDFLGLTRRVYGRFYFKQTEESVVQGISHRYGRQLQRSDGYAYFPQPTIALNKKEAASQAA
jgi:hypothetical protein